MQIAGFVGTRPGWQGVANRLIRARLSGAYSHTELVFESHDPVAAYMPDRSTQPDAAGALWSASSVAAERLPGQPLKGMLGYMINRSINLRRLRLPAPRVKPGDEI